MIYLVIRTRLTTLSLSPRAHINLLCHGERFYLQVPIRGNLIDESRLRKSFAKLIPILHSRLTLSLSLTRYWFQSYMLRGAGFISIPLSTCFAEFPRERLAFYLCIITSSWYINIYSVSSSLVFKFFFVRTIGTWTDTEVAINFRLLGRRHREKKAPLAYPPVIAIPQQ